MTRQLQDSLRELICKKYDAGKACIDIAEELEVPYKTVFSVITLYKNTGRITSVKRRRPRAVIVNREIEDFIKAMIGEDVSTTLEQMKTRILAKYRVGVSVSTLHRAIGDFL